MSYSDLLKRGVEEDDLVVLKCLIDIEQRRIVNVCEDPDLLFSKLDGSRKVLTWVGERYEAFLSDTLLVDKDEVLSGVLFLPPWSTSVFKSVVSNKIGFWLHKISDGYVHPCEDLVGYAKNKVRSINGSDRPGDLIYLVDGVSSSNYVGTFLNVFSRKMQANSRYDLAENLANLRTHLSSAGYTETEIDKLPDWSFLSTFVGAFEYEEKNAETGRTQKRLELSSVGDSLAIHMDKDGNIKQLVGGESVMLYEMKRYGNEMDRNTRSVILTESFRQRSALHDAIGFEGLASTQRGGRSVLSNIEETTATIENGDVVILVSDWFDKIYEPDSGTFYAEDRDGEKRVGEAAYLEKMAIPYEWILPEYRKKFSSCEMFGRPDLCLNGLRAKLFVEKLRAIVRNSSSEDVIFNLEEGLALKKRISDDDKSAVIRVF